MFNFLQQPEQEQQQQDLSPFLPVLSLTDSPSTTNFDYNITDTQHNIGYTNANQSNNFISTLPLQISFPIFTTNTSPLLSSSPVADKNTNNNFNYCSKGQADSNSFRNNNNNNNIHNLNTINNINNNLNNNININNSSVPLFSPRISFPQTIQQPQIQHNSATNTNNINNFLINNTTNLSDTITTPNFLGDNLNTASEFGTSYTLTAATPTVPTVGTPSTPYFNTPYISTSQLSPSYISTPPYINPTEETDYSSSITSTPFIPPTPLTTFNTPYTRNNNNYNNNNNNNYNYNINNGNNSNNNVINTPVNDSDPKIFDNSGQSSTWFNLFPTSQDSQQQISQLGEVIEEDILPSPQSYINITEQLQQLHLQQPQQYRQFSCSSTPLILNFDNFSPIIVGMDEGHNNPLSKSNTINNNEIHDNDHSLNNNNDNINTSNLNINPTSSEIATTSSSPSLASKQTVTTPIMTSPISTSNNNINNLLNTSFSLIKREESNNNNNIDETTISLTQKILSSASPSTISSNPGGMISTVPRLMVASDGSVGVNTIGATSTSDAIRKHENQLDHLTAEQEQQRNKKRPRTSVTEQQQQEDDTEEKKHLCPECGRGFNRKFNMQTHRSTHDPNRIKPFACEYSNCGSRFTRKHDLKRHINGIHKGEKVHECGVCRKPFSRKDAWKRHVTTCGKI